MSHRKSKSYSYDQADDPDDPDGPEAERGQSLMTACGNNAFSYTHFARDATYSDDDYSDDDSFHVGQSKSQEGPNAIDNLVDDLTLTGTCGKARGAGSRSPTSIRSRNYYQDKYGDNRQNSDSRESDEDGEPLALLQRNLCFGGFDNIKKKHPNNSGTAAAESRQDHEQDELGKKEKVAKEVNNNGNGQSFFHVYGEAEKKRLKAFKKIKLLSPRSKGKKKLQEKAEEAEGKAAAATEGSKKMQKQETRRVTRITITQAE